MKYLFISLFVIKHCFAQEVNLRENIIKNIFIDKHFSPIILNNNWNFDTIKSKEINALNFWNLRSYNVPKKQATNIKYKIVSLGKKENNIYFKTDSLQGIIYRYQLDSIYWIGKLSYKNIKSNSCIYNGFMNSVNSINSNQNIVLGFSSYNLILFSKTPEEHLCDNLDTNGYYKSRVIKLDSLFRFQELQIANNDDILSTTIFKNTHPQNSNYFTQYKNRLEGIGCYYLIETPTKSIWKMNIREVQQHFMYQYESAFPLMFRVIPKEQINKGELNPYVMWLYDDFFYTMPR